MKKMWLSFCPILTEVQVNKLFESKNIEKVKLLNDLTMLMKSIAKKLVLPTCNIDLLNSNIEEYLDPKPYLSYRFELKIQDLKEQNKLTNTDETYIIRCCDFLRALHKQLKQPLPDNVKVLQNISCAAICEVMKFSRAWDQSLSQAE